MDRTQVRGTISSAGFGGHRFVVGHWSESPIGVLSDVMWATPDDERILLVGSDDGAAFITSIYDFDDVRVGPLATTSDGRTTTAHGHGLDLELVGGRARPIPFRRPLAVTRFIERPIARRLMDVQTFGVSSQGVREWYQARGWRWVESGHATLDGVDLGAPGPVAAPLGVGFSEPPRRPSIVTVDVTIEGARLPVGSGARP